MSSPTAQALDPARLAWPDDGDAASDSLEANHDYIRDIRLARLEDVERVIARERPVLSLLSAAPDAEAEWEVQRERIAAQSIDAADDYFVALDPGVASATLALGAIGCIPYWSCNGGAYGGHHASPRPTIQFFARAEHAPLLLSSAQHASVGLSQDEHGRCAIVAESLDAMLAFALALSEKLHRD